MRALIGLVALLGTGYLLWRQFPRVSPLPAIGPGGTTPAASPPAASAARGIRNNNPGNLKGADAWQGRVGTDSGGFVVFDTPHNGLRAMFINLRNQARLHGLSTVASIIQKWDPAGAFLYIGNVAQLTGFAPNQVLNLDSRDVARSLGLAIIQVENGSQPYGLTQIEAALSAAGY